MLKKFISSLILILFTITGFSQEVSLFTACNYGGQRANLTAGSYNTYQMRIPNDKLASLQIPYGMRVIVYEHENFQGRSTSFNSNTPCLSTDWMNITSSLVVVNDNVQPNNTLNDKVTFYNDCYTRGYSQSLLPGTYTGAQLGLLRYSLSSFAISGNLRVRLYLNNENVSGVPVDYETDINCLPDGQNKRVGSLVIEYKNANPNYPGNTGTAKYASFYSDCDYKGNGLRLMPGRYSGADLGILKNKISSVEVPEGLRVKVYTNSEYATGFATNINENKPCLDYQLKGKITSLEIEERFRRGDRDRNNNPQNEGVTIYLDDNYQGQSATLRPGTYTNMQEAGNFPDNAISSITVPDGYRVVIYDFANFLGRFYTFTSSQTRLTIYGWNDRTSSISVYKDR